METTVEALQAKLDEQVAALPPAPPPTPKVWEPGRRYTPEEMKTITARFAERPPGMNPNGTLYNAEKGVLYEDPDYPHLEQQRRINNLWLKFKDDIGPRLAECKLDNFQVYDPNQEAVLAKVRAYADNMAENLKAGRNVVFVGPCGSGKDHLAIGLAKCGIKQCQCSVRWLNGSGLFAKMRDNMDDGRSEESAIERLSYPGILILSDPVPPGRKLTDYQADVLYRLVDLRWRNLKPTFATVNLAAGQADEVLGAAVADRLRHGALVLQCDWGSYRARECDAGEPHA